MNKSRDKNKLQLQDDASWDKHWTYILTFQYIKDGWPDFIKQLLSVSHVNTLFL